MKNSIIIIVFLFAFTGMASAQEAKATAKKTACCTSDQKVCKDTKKACDTNDPTCCLIADAGKAKCCADHKSKAISSTGDKEACKTNSACCADGKKAKTKA